MAEIDPDALLTATEGAAYAGVSVAVLCNWVGRGLLEPARRPDGTIIRDSRRRIKYRLLAIAKAEAATAERAGRVIFQAA